MESYVRLAAHDKCDPQQALADLAGRFTPCAEPPRASRLTIYDTFDWRLYQRGLALYAEGADLILYPLAKKGAIARARMASGMSFASDLPEGPLKELIAPLTGMRAVLPMATGYLRTTAQRILDQNDKTVAFLALHEVWPAPSSASGPPLAAQWRLTGIKGYRQQVRELRAALLQAGWQLGARDVVYDALLAAAGQVAGSYVDDLRIDLQPAMRSDEATRLILGQLLDVLKANEPYIRQDVDIEFLHDFRVSIRRTRAVLAQVKEVFPAPAVAHFRQEFSNLAGQSNQLRDLDVYLLRQAAYTEMLPAGLHDYIQPLFDYLRQRRAAALAAVIAGLDAPAYQQLMQAWESFVGAPLPAEGAGRNAGLPIVVTAQRRLRKRYRAIVKLGRALGPQAEDSALHALRIECKKLRYLLEFFASLFPPKKITQLILQLKTLQGILGAINDLSVQEAYLQQVAQELPLAGQQDRNILLAIGALIGKLDDEKQAARSQFAAAFAAFSAPETAGIVADLFKPRHSEAD
jgi:CHAD domain-containing protein